MKTRHNGIMFSRPVVQRQPGRKVPASAILCPSCGFCCNGVLFTEVKLISAAERARLIQAGLPLDRRGKSWRLAQPCPAFDGQRCRCYAERPAYCRQFNCQLLQRVQHGTISLRYARCRISQSRRLVEQVRFLVRQLGNTNEQQPLGYRYRRLLSEPWELDGQTRTLHRRQQLLRAVSAMGHLLERVFLRDHQTTKPGNSATRHKRATGTDQLTGWQ